METNERFKVGDKVCYSHLFLKSCGVPITGESWHVRGVIDGFSTWQSVDGFRVARVVWNNGERSKVNTFNLSKLGTIAACEPIHPVTYKRVEFGKQIV